MRRRMRHTLGTYLLTVAGLGIVGYAAAFIVRSFTHLIELGLGPEHVGATAEEIEAAMPGVYDYIHHVQVNLGAFIASTGVAIAGLAWFGVRRHLAWAWWAIALVTVVWAVGAIPVHFTRGLAPFSHLAPVYLAVVSIALGLWLAWPARDTGARSAPPVGGAGHDEARV